MLEKVETALATRLKTERQETELALPHRITAASKDVLNPHYEILHKAQRTNTAVNAMVAVASHAHRQLQAGAEVMINRLNAIDAHEAVEEVMLRVTGRCLTLMEAGVLALTRQSTSPLLLTTAARILVPPKSTATTC